MNQEESVSVNLSNCLFALRIPKSPPEAPDPALISLSVPPLVAGYISKLTEWCVAAAPRRMLAPLLPLSAEPFVGPSHLIVKPFVVKACRTKFWMFSTDPFTARSAYFANFGCAPGLKCDDHE